MTAELESLTEKIRLLKQEVDYVKSCSVPLVLSDRMEELVDAVYACQNRVTECENKMKKYDDKYFQVVTLEEAQNIYKISGATLAELGEHLSMDTSHVCRTINGDTKKNDFMAYHKIKQYCLNKISGEKKRLEALEQKKKNANIPAKV